MHHKIPPTLVSALAADRATRRRAKELIARVDDAGAYAHQREMAAFQCVGLLESLLRQAELGAAAGGSDQ